MNFLQATVSKSKKFWYDDENLRIEFTRNEVDNITGIICTKKQENKSKTFTPKGNDPYALVKMFQEMEQWVGKITHPSEMKKIIKPKRK